MKKTTKKSIKLILIILSLVAMVYAIVLCPLAQDKPLVYVASICGAGFIGWLLSNELSK